MHRLEVCVDEQVRHAVAAHHLRPTQLGVGLVHGGPEQLVECLEAGQDDGRVIVLDDALAEAQHVRADPDVARGRVAEREDSAVGYGRFGGDLARTL